MAAALDELLLQRGNVSEKLAVKARSAGARHKSRNVVCVETRGRIALGNAERLLKNTDVGLHRLHFEGKDLVVEMAEDRIMRIDAVVMALAGVRDEDEAHFLFFQPLDGGP